MNWNDIALKHKTDKSTAWSKMQPLGHGYMQYYEKHLVLKRITDVLEIGIDEGNSLRMWEEIFPQAHIVGVDKNPQCKEYAGGNIDVICADAGNAGDLVALYDFSPFDLIVDDASHKKEDVLLALDTLFSALSPGGTYVIEDMIWDDIKGDIGAWATCKEVIVSVYLSMNSSQSIIFLEKM